MARVSQKGDDEERVWQKESGKRALRLCALKGASHTTKLLVDMESRARIRVLAELSCRGIGELPFDFQAAII